jgi:tetratricopeptide (TPR) repeat protein
MLELDSTFSEAFRLKGHIYAAQNNFESALGNFNKASKLGNQWGQILMLMTLPRLGQKETARQIFAAAEKANPNGIPAMAKALVYYSFGETKKAMTWLNKSYEAKDFWLASLRVDPMWDPMRQETEFQQLMKKMNFPQ